VPVYGSVNIYSDSSGYSSHRGGDYARHAYRHGANDRDHNTHWNGNGRPGNGGHGHSWNGDHSGSGGSHGGGNHSGGSHGGGNHGSWNGQH
jgi:hypothetical protein